MLNENFYTLAHIMYCKYCGKECKNLNSLKQHECRCKQNPNMIINPMKNKDTVIKNKIKSLQTLRNNYKIKKENKIAEYDKNPKLCLQCGKPLSCQQAKSGRKFCCGRCSNLSRPPRSEDIINKTRETLIKNKHKHKQVIQKQLRIEEYNKKPKRCVICNNALLYEKRDKKTCCKECHNKLISIKMTSLERHHDKILGTNCKKGYYHNIWCDSSWELAFLVYCLDKGFKIERCNEQIEYNYKNEMHKYYPDFILNKNIYIEVKGFEDDKVKYKEESMERLNKKYHIIRKDVIEKIINKLKQKYEFKNVWDLYEVRVQ